MCFVWKAISLCKELPSTFCNANVNTKQCHQFSILFYSNFVELFIILCTGALVSSGTRWIFFLLSGMILCFGFRWKEMLITHLCFSCCWAVICRAKDFSVFQILWGEYQKDLRGDRRARTADLNWPKVFYHMICEKRMIKLKVVDWGVQLLLRDWLGISKWVVSKCNAHHVFCKYIYVIILYYYYYFSLFRFTKYFYLNL